jgi:hypothetical protein
MNFKLILQLSLFGLFMALATVFFIPSNIEPLCWLVIFLVCAYFIAKQCNGKYFLHGFLTSLVNCVWITAAHVLLFTHYMATHQQEMDSMTKMPAPLNAHPRLAMLIVGPIVGILSGLVLGLFAFVASKIVKKK